MRGSGCRVFIPSYRRPGAVKTLVTCPDAVLVVAESERESYAAAYPDAKIWGIPDGVQGNIARVRNYILDNAGYEAVAMMDDDIASFGYFEGDPSFGYERVRLSGDAFDAFVERYTELCYDMGLHLWGVNIQAANRLYHQAEPFSLTKVVLGPFNVHIESPVRYDEDIPLKEDYDLFLRHMQRFRGVLRVNGAWYANDGSKGAKGGCSEMRDVEEERRQFGALERRWGSSVVRRDGGSRRGFDFNPKIRVPIAGV